MTEQQSAIPLERSDLEQASLGDAEFEKELLSEFLDSTTSLLGSLSEALASRDVQLVHRTAHSLKGCCWTVGARSMGSACEELELQARGGVLDRAESLVERIHDLFGQLDVYVRRTWSL